MPKIKTNSGAAKRFKVTKKGKVKYTKAQRRHILTGKPAKQKRRMRESSYLSDADAKNIKRIMPYS